jgi:ATP-binding cassette subfamily B protein
MAALPEFPTASASETIAFCWQQVEGQKRQLITSWVVMVLAVVMADIACPLVFAAILNRVSSLPAHATAGEWHAFGPLLCAYATAALVAVGFWRIAGWLEWGACVRSFATGVNNGYHHLLTLSYRWHMDHPAGEVISSLGNFSWAFVEMVDVASWGLLPVVVVVLSAITVLAVFAWPAALALLVMVSGFVVVIYRRLRLVRAASEAFENHHSQATGVVADTVTNLMAVRSAATEPLERRRVEDLMRQSVAADLRARSIFMRTQLELESSIVLGTLLALIAGTTMAVHHWASTAALYLILYYSAQVALNLQQSFEHLRLFARSLGRAAKFTAIAGEEVEIHDAPQAGRLEVSTATVEFSHVGFGYRSGAKLFDDLNITVEPGEHVALVGPSGSGKSTLSKLLLRLMDVECGRILVDGQDIRDVTLSSLRGAISYVPQDPQLLHRTIAENICYGVDRGPDGGWGRRCGIAGRGLRDRPRRGPGRPCGGVRLRAARRVRHGGGRTGPEAVRRPASAGGYCPGNGQTGPHPGVGRGHCRPRLGVRAPRARGAVAADGAVDGAGDRPPALHHRPHGPHHGVRPGEDRGGGYPRRAARPRWARPVRGSCGSTSPAGSWWSNPRRCRRGSSGQVGRRVISSRALSLRMSRRSSALKFLSSTT